jgi:hypothetical protein
MSGAVPLRQNASLRTQRQLYLYRYERKLARSPELLCYTQLYELAACTDFTVMNLSAFCLKVWCHVWLLNWWPRRHGLGYTQLSGCAAMSLGIAVIEQRPYSRQKISGHLLGQDCRLHHCVALFLVIPMNTDELHK